MDHTRVELDPSRNIDDYKPLFDELTPALGERFPESIKNWCGIGLRPYPLAVWRVFLIRIDGKIGGVAGLYRRLEDPAHRLWIGWFGLLLTYQGKGFARRALHILKQIAVAEGASELCVYTDAWNSSALATYKAVGFIERFVVDESKTGRAADPNGVLLALDLNRNDKGA